MLSRWLVDLVDSIPPDEKPLIIADKPLEDGTRDPKLRHRPEEVVDTFTSGAFLSLG
jgi:hypothetical protein